MGIGGREVETLVFERRLLNRAVQRGCRCWMEGGGRKGERLEVLTAQGCRKSGSSMGEGMIGSEDTGVRDQIQVAVDNSPPC